MTNFEFEHEGTKGLITRNEDGEATGIYIDVMTILADATLQNATFRMEFMAQNPDPDNMDFDAKFQAAVLEGQRQMITHLLESFGHIEEVGGRLLDGRPAHQTEDEVVEAFMAQLGNLPETHPDDER